MSENVYRRRNVCRDMNAYLLKQQYDLRSAEQNRLAARVNQSQKKNCHESFLTAIESLMLVEVVGSAARKKAETRNS